MKGSLSKWISERKFVPWKFHCQAGYGSFTYSYSQIDIVFKYIENLEKDHKRKAFKEEYEEFLKSFDIPYDGKYILEDVD
jgi:putative transposase